jgi:hypothetical protein
MQTTLTTAISFLLLSAAILLCISPEAKHWAAEVLHRLDVFLCSELEARAKAQTAARSAWDRVYREQRGACPWNTAAPSSHLMDGLAAVDYARAGTAGGVPDERLVYDRRDAPPEAGL